MINDKIFILGWSNPFNVDLNVAVQLDIHLQEPSFKLMAAQGSVSRERQSSIPTDKPSSKKTHLDKIQRNEPELLHSFKSEHYTEFYT